MVKILKLFLLLVFVCFQVNAQTWLPGYNYRKKITINKAMVSGSANLEHFQLLVALEDADLRYVASNCSGNKISGSKGRDFAFTLVSAPQTPLSYQLDHYTAATGKLLSWVRIPLLAASGTSTAATQIYLYYGSNTIHFPKAAAAQQTWNNDQGRIWHMNFEGSGRSVVNGATSVVGESLHASSNMSMANEVPGKIGNAVSLNGSNQYLSSGKINSTNFLISCWVKFAATNREQVVISTDSAAFGGYGLRLQASGRLLQETRTNNTLSTRQSSLVMVPDRWYHVVSQFYQDRREIYIDGVNSALGLGNVSPKQGGSLVVGASKVGDKYFGGIIDELRIQTVSASPDWIMTSYVNQRDPAAFYVVSGEEVSLQIQRTGMVFNSVRNQFFDEAANWNSQEVPGNYEQVILAPGAKLDSGIPAGLSLNRLSLEAGAEMLLDKHLEVLCETRIDAGATLGIRTGAFLQLDGTVLNHGTLESTPDAFSGGVMFSGSATQLVSGTGLIKVEQVLLDKATKSAMLKLEQPLVVTDYVKTIMGVLNANGYLRLKHSGSLKQAFLWSITNPDQAGVTGEVIVEQLVSGNFPAPATARGWRLWSSPVYHGLSPSISYYHLYGFKAAMFVTGAGGLINGFDASPQNGHTIYTHDQSVMGSLSQKYIGIPTMNTTVDVGRSIYVFSRGDRLLADAYSKQIQTAPFQSPGSYLIEHRGLLFQGSLQLELQNRNMGESGDGFHLLGNPYAATINWADLQKENLSPYLWKFNPLNNAYDVSNDLTTTIGAGEGFFVKVLNGQSRGSIAFSEFAKRNGLTADKRLADVSAGKSRAAKLVATDLSAGLSKINLVLSRDAFEQRYTLMLEPGGNNAVDDRDATALGTGYVSIAGLAGAGTKLSVDTREQPGRRQLEVPLFVKGYTTGKYQLRISGIETLEPGTRLILLDRYLNTQQVLSEDQDYEFDLNTAVEGSFGEKRFALRLEPVLLATKPEAAVPEGSLDVLIYPNPFQHGFELKLPAVVPFRMELRLRDLLGRMVLRRNFGQVNGSEVLHMETPDLSSGAYLLELFNLDTNRPIKTAKLIKR